MWRQMQVNRRYAHLTSLSRASIFILIIYFYWNKHFTREAQRRQTKHLPNSLSSKINTKIELTECMCPITWPKFEIRFGWRQNSHETQIVWWCITHFSFPERIQVVDVQVEVVWVRYLVSTGMGWILPGDCIRFRWQFIRAAIPNSHHISKQGERFKRARVERQMKIQWVEWEWQMNLIFIYKFVLNFSQVLATKSVQVAVEQYSILFARFSRFSLCANLNGEIV